MKSNEFWDDDAIQFARLLSEIAAIGLSEGDEEELCRRTGFSFEKLDEVFERAAKFWERAKIIVAISKPKTLDELYERLSSDDIVD